MPREVLLDSQGRAVEQTLKSHEFPIDKCRVGKFIEVEVPLQNESEAKAHVERMAQFVFCNPLIENYEIVRM